ncbi:MAG: DnaJ domain-containing protein [Acidimicrobiia bacterium]
MSTRTWFATDYYEALGVERSASTEEIAQAFRSSAKDHHPDRTDDAEARERFKELSAAYGVLGNPELRARYDLLRTGQPAENRRAAPSDARLQTDGYRAETPHLDANRPLSVRALPERRHVRWASIGGIALLVAGVVSIALAIWLAGTAPGGTVNGSDPTGRNLTLALVAVKLIVVGLVFAILGNRRRRYP